MIGDPKSVEVLVETITREILEALQEGEVHVQGPNGTYCRVECSEGLRVTTCYDNLGRVVSAGAERFTSTLGSVPPDANLAAYIDHTLLKPDATIEQVKQLCAEAKEFNFASVCVNPFHIKLCAELLKGTPVKVCSVVGFPLGATPTAVKVFETKEVVRDGAQEVDMVINIGALKSRELEVVAEDIASVVNAAHFGGAIVKVIIETALLTDEEKVIACLLSKEAGADFVKTSTGFAKSGATVEDVQLMRRVVGPAIGVKAAGGIRTREDATAMVKSGATRLGASAGVKIVKGEDQPVAAGAKSAY
jgi:deoxyribose-phosphate aldolase